MSFQIRCKTMPRRKIYTVDGELHMFIQSVFNKDKLADWISKFEEEFAHFIGVKYAIIVPSGRKGMEFIFKSLGLNKGDEVIIPAYTLKDLIGIIQSLGLNVIPADIDSKTFNIDSDSVAKRITKRTKVILATHLFGVPCQIDRVLEIAKANSIFVVEDCAHSIGSEFKKCKTGSFGEAAFFSFDTIKLINTYGGGMVVTDNKKLASKVRMEIARLGGKPKLPLKKIISAVFETIFLPSFISLPFLHLLASSYWNKKIYDLYREMQKLSTPQYLFTGVQAFIGLEKLKTLRERIIRRQNQADLLKTLLNNKIIFQQIENEILPNYYFFVALLPVNVWKARKSLLTHGIDAGIGAEIADDCGSILGDTDCHNAKKIFHQAIQLPLHEDLTHSNIYYIADSLNKIF